MLGAHAVKADFRPSDTLILDRHGEIVQRHRTDATVRRGEWVALADVSPALRTALVLSEDQRFYAHSGVDWRAVPAAAWGNLWNTRTRGASTLTMQLAGLLDGDWRAGPGGRSVLQKVGQAVSATQLEGNWRKDQILEGYLNLVPFRGEIVGIDALARTLFGKAAHGLNAREAAVAAALVRAPNAAPARVTQRACGVLRMMAAAPAPQPASAAKPSATPARVTASATHAAAVDCAGMDLFVTGVLQRRAWPASEGIAPHLGHRLVAQGQPSPQPPDQAGGRLSPSGRGSESRSPAATNITPNPSSSSSSSSSSSPSPSPSPSSATSARAAHAATSITSSLHAPLQRFALQTLQRHLRELRGRKVEDGAVVVLDNASGEVLAWVGSSGELSDAAEVDGVLALRQPGSTLKPFLYAQAIAEQRLTAASLLEDAPTHIPTASGLYIPQNYDRQFKGWVSARTALAASLNVPAVRTLVMVSPEAFARHLRAVGLPLRETGDFYGYSLALGSAEVPLLALTIAYRTLANGGRFSEVAIRPVSGPAKGSVGAPAKPALDPGAAFIVGDILSDTNARARTFGTDSVLATRFWTAVKTGTSKDMRDNWAVGWSQRYTVGVWVGNASGAPMHDVSGTSGAAPVWAAVMQRLHAHTPSRAPAPPAGITSARVQFGRQLEASRAEWFLPGTEQAPFDINTIANNDHLMPGKRQNGLKINNTAPTQATRITAPADGTILALDPDIPPARQRVHFTADAPGAHWLLDGKRLASGAMVPWLPWPGRHRVTLVSAEGQALDEIRLEVRGAGVSAVTRK
jgi:penicillin-binding protein 1C